MGLYLYCIAPAGSVPIDGLLGMNGRPVGSIEIGPFALWTSDLEERPGPTLDRIRTHNEVVEASVSDRITPLPIRFGEWLPSRDALEQRIESHRAAYEAALERVAGALEFGIRVLDPSRDRTESGTASAHSSAVAESDLTGSEPAVPDRPDSGREYMAALARRVTADNAIRLRGEAVAEALRAELEGLVRRERLEMLHSAHGLVSVAHLVQRQNFQHYRARVRIVGGRFPHLRFLTSGPWPPYSFVT